MNFEKNLDRLEKIVAQMESGDITLQESLKMFKEGVGISKECHKQLDEAEQQIKLLLEVSPDGVVKTEDFTESTEDSTNA